MRPDHTLRGFQIAPGAVPVLGHIPPLYRDALAFLRASHDRAGPVFWVDFGFGSRRLFYLGDDQLDVFRDPGVAMDFAGLEGLANFARDSVFVADGEPHRRMRSAMNREFSPRGVAAFGATLSGVVDAAIKGWIERGDISVIAATRRLALEAAFAAIGVAPRDVTRWQAKYRQVMLGLVPLPWVSKFVSGRAGDWVDAAMRSLARKARDGRRRDTILGMLLSKVDDGAISELELIGNLRILALAGHETTSSVMAWSLIKIAEDARLWRRLVDEAGASPTPASNAEASRFTFAESIFREASRLHSPAWFVPRRAVRDLHLKDASIPAGTPMMLSPLWINRSAAVFRDPDVFDPFRWVGRQVTAAEMTAFGHGPHFCVGYHVAMLEGIQTLVALVRASTERGLRLRLAGKPPTQRYLPASHPDGGTRIVFEKS